MRIRHYAIIAVGAALIGAAAGLAWRTLDQPPAPMPPAPATAIEQLDTLPDFSYPDSDGRVRHSDEFATKVLILNFWATWCPPCRQEIPLFVALQQELGAQVQFVGIAIDDAEPVLEFAAGHAVNYPLLLGDSGAIALSRQLGNRAEGLPFTVVAKPGGEVVMRHTGELRRDQLEPLLSDLVEAQR